MEVLTYCVRAHGYRMRYFIILNNLAQKVGWVMRGLLGAWFRPYVVQMGP